MQEKFRQAGENLDDLNRWLERVEREIASQEIPQENVDSLKNQIKSLKVRLREYLVVSSDKTFNVIVNHSFLGN